jgi:hypothetical protein
LGDAAASVSASGERGDLCRSTARARYGAIIYTYDEREMTIYAKTA